MEVAYLEQNRRYYELTKNVSLAMLDPVALIKLKATGECDVRLPEEIFDLDYPGHYMRRIKSVGLTIPCVAGPNTTVNCTLRLDKHAVRSKPSRNTELEETFGIVQSIATSSGQNDSGLFELNFRDERYLPFEGAGVISLWHLELPNEFKQFDYDTISDVIMHIRYTAREGGDSFKKETIDNLAKKIKNTEIELAKDRKAPQRIFSLRHDFSNEWNNFIHNDSHTMEFEISTARFPLVFHEKDIEIKKVKIYIQLKPELNINADLEFKLNNIPIIIEKDTIKLGNLLYKEQDFNIKLSGGGPKAIWKLELKNADALIEKGTLGFEDIYLVCVYSVTEPKK
jgi:hypothetical protein